MLAILRSGLMACTAVSLSMRVPQVLVPWRLNVAACIAASLKNADAL
jgi:hypothetical protein